MLVVLVVSEQLSNNCLCFLFPLIYGHHGTFTDEQQLRTVHGIFTELSRTYERTTIRDISRNIHGTSKDLRTNSNCGLFTEYSQNFHGLTDERQLRKFHGIFTDLRMSRNCSRIIMVTGHKTSDRSCINIKIPLERFKYSYK